MGLETAALVLAAIAEVGQGVYEVQAANKQEEAIDRQSKEVALQNQQKTLSNYDVLQKVLDAQTAHQTVTGTAFSSPSFNAIQRNTLNIGSKRQKNRDIENSLEDENTAIEKQVVRDTLYAQLFGDASKTALSVASVYTKTPKTGG